MGFVVFVIVMGILYLACGGGSRIADTFRSPDSAESGVRKTYGDYINTPTGQEALRRAREYDKTHNG